MWRIIVFIYRDLSLDTTLFMVVTYNMWRNSSSRVWRWSFFRQKLRFDFKYCILFTRAAHGWFQNPQIYIFLVTWRHPPQRKTLKYTPSYLQQQPAPSSRLNTAGVGSHRCHRKFQRRLETLLDTLGASGSIGGSKV